MVSIIFLSEQELDTITDQSKYSVFDINLLPLSKKDDRVAQAFNFDLVSNKLQQLLQESTKNKKEILYLLPTEDYSEVASSIKETFESFSISFYKLERKIKSKVVTK